MKVKPIWISNSKGETGIQGIQGNTGVIGYTGVKGSTGLIGATGIIGLEGETGLPGPVGIQGVTGFGITGVQGLEGPRGETGINGEIGSQGITGIQGTTGVSGGNGDTGLPGTIGIQGNTGVSGVTGAKGEGVGIDEVVGSTGTLPTYATEGYVCLVSEINSIFVSDGESPISSWVYIPTVGDQGTTGIQGEPGHGSVGPIGATGIQGTTGSIGLTGFGVQGSTGLQGARGYQGFDGWTGVRGETGINGVQGNTGAQGLHGATGLNGIAGVQGSTGIDGLVGETGVQGEIGNTGLNGIQGETGLSGLQGITGINGLQGETGLQGITGVSGTQGITGVSGFTGLNGIQGETGLQGLHGATGLDGLEGSNGDTGVQGETGVQGATGLSPEIPECTYIYYQGKYSEDVHTGQTLFGSDMPTIDENELISDTVGYISLDYENGGFKVPSDIRFVDVSLNFAFSINGDTGVYKDFRYNLIAGDAGFGATGTDTNIITKGSVQPPDTLNNYTSCTSITVDTENFGKYINVLWLGDLLNSYDVQFSLSIVSTAGIKGDVGATGLGSEGDHLVLRSADDTSPGYLSVKFTSDANIGLTGITEDDIKKILISLVDPLTYVKGTSIYGGSLETNFNTISRDEFFTGYYDATGAPPAQTGNPSWFGQHWNSNTGTVSAYQIAVAYVNTSIICYERVKLSSTWGSWILRSSGSSISMMDTMTIGGAFSSCALNPGSDTQWSGHGTRIQPYGNLTALISSVMKISMPQVVSGKSLIFGLYSYNESTHLQTKKAATGIITMPSSSSDLVGTLTDLIDGSFNTSDIYYAVVFTNANGCSVRGVMSSTMNFHPYASGLINNLGVLTAAPSSFTFENESANNLFVRVKV
jgi:hypothetical protein